MAVTMPRPAISFWMAPATWCSSMACVPASDVEDPTAQIARPPRKERWASRLCMTFVLKIYIFPKILKLIYFERSAIEWSQQERYLTRPDAPAEGAWRAWELCHGRSGPLDWGPF